MLDGVFFDLDGTLVDTAPDFVLAVNLLRKQHHLSPLDTKLIASQVSNGSIALTQLAFDINQSHLEFSALRQQLLDNYKLYLGEKSLVYAGLHQLLSELDSNNVPWGVVTNKPVEYAQPLMEKLALSESCSVLICPEHVANTKPDPEPLLLATKKTGCNPSRSLYVGDHRRDIEAGRAAGMQTIAAGYGYVEPGNSATDWHADHTAQTSAELAQIIRLLLS